MGQWNGTIILLWFIGATTTTLPLCRRVICLLSWVRVCIRFAIYYVRYSVENIMVIKLKNILFEELELKDLEGGGNEELIAGIILGKEPPSEDITDQEEQDQKNITADEVNSEIKKHLVTLPTPSLETINEIFFEDMENPKSIKGYSDEEGLFQKILQRAKLLEFQKYDRGCYRLKPTDSFKNDLITNKITPQQFINDLKNERKHIFRGFAVDELPGGAPGGGSGKFVTYIISSKLGLGHVPVTIKIVITAGGNKGHDFEKEVVAAVLAKQGPIWINLICFLLTNEMIASISDIKDYIFTSKTKRIGRAFTDKVDNVGPVIADLTIILNNKNPIYVSLKGERGLTLANTGYAGAFTLTKDNEKVKVEVAEGSNSTIDSFLQALGVDKTKMAAGFTAYANGYLGNSPGGDQKTDKITMANKEKIENYLSSQIGFGYIYFRRTSSSQFKIINLTEKNIKEITGEVIGGIIRYPYFKKANKRNASRQCSVELNTTTATYLVEIRNTQTMVSPYQIIDNLQCNIRILKTIEAKDVGENKLTCTTNGLEELIDSKLVTDQKPITNLKEWIFS